MRFTELTHRKPELALAIIMAAGMVVAQRLQSNQQRIPLCQTSCRPIMKAEAPHKNDIYEQKFVLN